MVATQAMNAATPTTVQSWSGLSGTGVYPARAFTSSGLKRQNPTHAHATTKIATDATA